jgi:hypothetical protein
MPALTRSPQNTNLQQPSKYILSFDKIGGVQYFCQSFNLPGISIDSAPRVSPVLDMNYPGTKITYKPFTISFLVDEGLTSWNTLHNWFLAIGHPIMDERNRLLNLQNGKRKSDATLTILSNLNNPLVRIQFLDVYPTNLSDLSFDTRSSSEDIMTATADFYFSYYTLLTL